MDRDDSGTITRKELDCEEFRDVLRYVITPHVASLGTGGAVYARVTQNIEQAMDFCLRKADFNNDKSLSFEEFKAFLVVLRSKHDAAYTANLIFALFDLDSDSRINQAEFREVYRYYLGHHPTANEFAAEWARLDAGGHDEVTRDEYTRWLQTSANPIFQVHAPMVRGFSQNSLGTLSNIGDKSLGSGADVTKAGPSRTLPGLNELDKSGPFRARWNQNFNTKKNGNHELPGGQREMFSRAQSLPELGRYYELHRGFAQNSVRFKTQPELRRHKAVLSTESIPSMTPSRDVSGGTMRHPLSGRTMKWNDHWQEPAGMKKRPLPVTLLFQCPGKAPASLDRG
jgi:Ca2+-binding EF-hand superfamily protein